MSKTIIRCKRRLNNMLAEVLNNFAHHLLQNDFYQENNLNQMLEGLLFYLALFLIQFLLLMVLLFYSNQNYLWIQQCQNFKSRFSFVNLLYLAVVKYLDLMPNISAIIFFFFTKLLISGVFLQLQSMQQ